MFVNIKLRYNLSDYTIYLFIKNIKHKKIRQIAGQKTYFQY